VCVHPPIDLRIGDVVTQVTQGGAQPRRWSCGYNIEQDSFLRLHYQEDTNLMMRFVLSRAILLVLLASFSAHLAVAQQSNAEVITIEVQQTGIPITLTFALPEGWSYQYSIERSIVQIASSDAAMEKLTGIASPFEEGGYGISIGLPEFLAAIDPTLPSSPEAVLQLFMVIMETEGSPAPDDSFTVPALAVTLDTPDGTGDAIALDFAEGTILVLVQPGRDDDPSLAVVLESISYGSGLLTASDPTSELTELVTAPSGTFNLAVSYPPDWSADVGGSTLYIANSSQALNSLIMNLGDFEADAIAITIAPVSILGLEAGATLEEAAAYFRDLVGSESEIETDSTFDLPGVHVTLERGIPGGSGELYVLEAAPEPILVALQPAGEPSEMVLAIVNSIQVLTETVQNPIPQSAPQPGGDFVRQWASTATGSSQYGKVDWGFIQAIGEPDTMTCGDFSTAWASETTGERAILTVEFEQAVIPVAINIHQSFNPGAIVQVDVGNSANRNRVLPLEDSADAVGNTPCPGVFTVDASAVSVPIDFVVIYLDQAEIASWNEIDAVELVGMP